MVNKRIHEKLAIKLIAMAGGIMAVAPIEAEEYSRRKSTNHPVDATELSMAENSSQRVVNIDFFALQGRLLGREVADGSRNDQAIRLGLPLPEGGNTEFVLRDSGVLPPGLARRYPQIRSLKGRDIKGREARVDISDNGLRVAVYDLSGVWFVRPLKQSLGTTVDKNTYISTRSPDASAAKTLPYEPWMRSDEAAKSISTKHDEVPEKARVYDNHLRNYRLAIAATSGYSKYVGESLANTLASVAHAVNRSNAIFERDAGIYFTLVEDNDKIVFTDPSLDPYVPRNDEEKEDLGFIGRKNEETLKKIIGIDNFDAGHVFTDGNDGVGLPACQGDTKTGAASGLVGSPAGPVYDEDFLLTVTHELGHQFGADHVANGCERDSNYPFEPGSGSSVMSYAGACFKPFKPGMETPEINVLHELQDHQDSYFNGKSIEQIRQFVSSGTRSSCGRTMPNPSRPPLIHIRHGDRQISIPARTPFTLIGSAQSENRNAQLTYAWEQIDIGPEQPTDEVLVDKGQGPIFRSFPPTTSGARVFPELEAVLGTRELGFGEVYPSTTRDLNFRLTVRDNLEDRSSTSFRDQKIHVQDTGRAFAVTYPTGATTWRGGDRKLVKWDVAGTANAPILCRNVRIDLSIDGGRIYLSQPLLAITPNTGSAAIKVPAGLQRTSRARVRVSCNGNVFFAVSPANFKLL